MAKPVLIPEVSGRWIRPLGDGTVGHIPTMAKILYNGWQRIVQQQIALIVSTVVIPCTLFIFGMIEKLCYFD
jgi:actin-like ATPase involved in cell morphogenesis